MGGPEAIFLSTEGKYSRLWPAASWATEGASRPCCPYSSNIFVSLRSSYSGWICKVALLNSTICWLI